MENHDLEVICNEQSSMKHYFINKCVLLKDENKGLELQVKELTREKRDSKERNMRLQSTLDHYHAGSSV